MLWNQSPVPWYYMEIPRTASTSIDRYLRQRFRAAYAPYYKHWPVSPERGLTDSAPFRPLRIVSVRNPYRRAVSAWRFTKSPVPFSEWLRRRKNSGFYAEHIVGKPQSFWLRSSDDGRWDIVLRADDGTLNLDMIEALHVLCPETAPSELPVLNATQYAGQWIDEYTESDSVRLVREIYAEDFDWLARYGYEFPEVPEDEVKLHDTIVDVVQHRISSATRSPVFLSSFSHGIRSDTLAFSKLKQWCAENCSRFPRDWPLIPYCE